MNSTTNQSNPLSPRRRPGAERTLNIDTNLFPFDAFTANGLDNDPRTLTLDDSWNLTLGGNFVATGDVSITGTLDVDGAVTFNTTLEVTENVDLNGELDVEGVANLNNTDIDGVLDVFGAAAFHSTLELTGNADFNGNLDVDGTTNVDGLTSDGNVGIGRSPTQKLDVYNNSGTVQALIESNGGEAQLDLKNTILNWRMYVSSADGDLWFQNITNNLSPLHVEISAPNDLLTLRSVGRADFGGAVAIGSGGRMILTTGTYNALDVANTATIYCNTVGGDITINDFTGGVTGQRLSIVKSSSSNDLNLTASSGSNQQMQLTGGSITLSTDVGGILLDFAGTYWTETARSGGWA